MLWNNLTTGVSLGNASSVQLDNSIAQPFDVLRCTIEVTDSEGAFVSETIELTTRTAHPQSQHRSHLPTSDEIQLDCISSAFDLDDTSEPSISVEWQDANGNILGTDTVFNVLQEHF